MALAYLVPILQLSIGPLIVVSGIGLILLSMTNRFGRVLDRSRQLLRELRDPSGADGARIHEQLAILSKRARLIRGGIACCVLSILLASVLVISIFLGDLLNLDIGVEVAGLFILCMLSLIAALVLFLSDINLSLHAFWLELETATRS